jgi:hypothetical protein
LRVNSCARPGRGCSRIRALIPANRNAVNHR